MHRPLFFLAGAKAVFALLHALQGNGTAASIYAFSFASFGLLAWWVRKQGRVAAAAVSQEAQNDR